MNKKILIIGRGFIGQSIFDEISKKKIFDIEIIGSREISSATKKYDVVIFASGNSSPRKSSIDPTQCLVSNCAMLLEAIQKFNLAHWILVSSVSVYENSRHKIHKEGDELFISDKTSIYSAHKLLNELYIKKFIKEYCILRLSYTYGELSRKNIFYDLRLNKKTLYLDKKSILRPINVKYISDFTIKIINYKKKGIINIGNNNIISVDEILKLKKLRRTFKNERIINESNVSVDKFIKESKFDQNKEELIDDIKRYINFKN